MNVSGYFTKRGKSVIFTGTTLEIFIPMRYEIHGFLEVGATMKTIGFFDMVINGSIKTGYMLAAIIEIAHSKIETITVGGEQFYKLTLNKGDAFLMDTSYVQIGRVGYALFYEMTNSGHYQEFMSYERCATIYDYIARISGTTFNTNHAVFEMVHAQLFRDSKDIGKLFRNTPMTKEPARLGLRAIAQVATSVTGKISGSYAKQGVESAIANGGDGNSDIEDLLRS